MSNDQGATASVSTSQYVMRSKACRWILSGLVAVLLAGFFVQIPGPLRIDTDVVYYLSIAASFADGYGLNLYGSPSPLPVGYPIIVGLIDRAGLAGASTFVIMNLVFLVGALLLLYLILRAECDGNSITALYLVVLFMSSFVITKYLPRARSEMISLFSSWASLWCLTSGRRACGRRKAGFILAGAVLMLLAISIRSIGLALIPALVWALVPAQVRLRGVNHRVWFCGVVLGVAGLIAIAVWVLTPVDYVQDWLRQVEASSLQSQLLYTARAKLHELGQLALNLPGKVVPWPFKSGLKLVGFVVCLFIIRALWQRRKALSTVDVFVMATLGILFLWPGDAPRFWLPILPFVARYVVCVVRDTLPVRPRAILAVFYLTLSVVLGIGVQVVLTRQAFSKDFATTYGDRSLAEEYEAVADGPGHGEIDDPAAFRVLLRYDRRASAEWDRSLYPPYSVPAGE